MEKVGRVTTIGINRPEKRNCLDSHTSKLLEEAIVQFEEDSNSFAAVLYGTGGNFCSGYDLQEIAETDETQSTIYNFSIVCFFSIVFVKISELFCIYSCH